MAQALEREKYNINTSIISYLQIIHNYGHSGYGIMYSWGCACLAVELAVDILTQSKI